MSQDKLALIRQSLAAAESSIKTAKQLLSEVESGGLKAPAKDLPGEMGVFDGVNLLSEAGEKYPVPANYASKSLLVVGDTLKLVEEDGEKRFKQIEHVKRHKTIGILHKKDGKFKVITPEGSYNVLEVAVEHFKGEVGDEVVLHLPAGNLTAGYGAIETITKKVQPTSENEDEEAKPEPKVAPKTEAPKPPAPKPAPPKRIVRPAVSAPVAKPAAPAPAPQPPKVVAPKVEAVVTPPPIGDDELR